MIIKENLPENWKFTQIKDVCELVMGQSPPGSSYNENGNGMPFLQGKAEFGDTFPQHVKYTNKPLRKAKKGNVLMSVRAPVGDVNIANIDYCIGRGLASLDLVNGENKYLFYILNYLKPKIEESGTGSTFKAITKSGLEKIEIPIPPLEIQRKIVKILDGSEKLKEWRVEADELTDKFIKSVFLDMFGHTGINPKKWPLMKAEEICSKEKNAIKAGPFGSALKKEFYVENGYKIYGQEQVIRDDLSYGDYYIPEKIYKKLENCKIKEGDVLISLVGSYGKISIVPPEFEPGIINPRLMKISLNRKIILPVFFKFLLNSEGIKKKIEHVSHGGTMNIINVKIIKELAFPIPPIKLQEQFVEVIEQVNKLKTHQQQSKQQINSLFNVLVQKAFKGELIC